MQTQRVKNRLGNGSLLAADLPSFASVSSRGEWKAYKHCTHLANELAPGIARGNFFGVVNWPRRHGKSEMICKWLPAWYLSWFPHKRVVLASAEASLAAMFGRQVRDLFGDRVRPDHMAANDWELRGYGGGMRTAGIGGSLIGRGGDLLIFDDPHKDWYEATSQAYLERVRHWWRSVFWPMQEPGASVIVVMTRWHGMDHTGWLEKHSEIDWNRYVFKALADEGDPLGRPAGAPLCADRYDREALLAIEREIGTARFAAMYQQEPLDEDGGVFRREWIQLYEERPQIFDRVVCSWDLTFGATGVNASWCVGQAWGQLGNDFYLLDQVRARLTFNAQLDAITTLADVWGASRVYIEDAATARPARDVLRERVIGLELVPPRGSKVARAQAVQYLWEAKRVFIPHPSLAKWVPAFVEEHVLFPNGTADDQVDCGSLGLAALTGPGPQIHVGSSRERRARRAAERKAKG